MEENQSFDMEKMLKAMEMLKGLQDSIALPPVPQQQNFDKEAYDAPILNGQLLAMKAAIPHLPKKNRRNFTIFIKMMELQNLIAYYNQQTEETEEDEPLDENWKRNMIIAVRPHIDETKRQKLDMLLNMANAKQMMDNMAKPKDV